MGRVVHFELPVDEPERAATFYRDVFGWTVERWGEVPYWLVGTGEDNPGIDGALTMREEPDRGVVNTIDVQSVDDTLRKVEAAGGQILMAKSAVQGVGWVAYARDTEGNMIGMMESDPDAA